MKKTITFNKIKLLNFCGIREGEYEFGDKISAVSGINGIGKSTVASAITYVLFGTDILERSFSIKTLDEHNQVIRDISHEAELILSVDGEVVSLKRVLVDSWKGDSVKNTFKYLVNGETVTAGEYRKTVNNICPEKLFRLCISPTSFVLMPWQEQYAMIKALVPEVTYEDVTAGETKYDPIEDELRKTDTDKLLHHLRYSRKEVQQNLDEIPVRIAEINKVKPRQEDWEALYSEMTAKEEQHRVLQEKIASIMRGNADDVAKEGLRNKISFANKRIINMEQSAHNEAMDEATKHQSDLITKQDEVRRAKRTVEDLEQKITTCQEIRKNSLRQTEDIKAQAKPAGQRYVEVSKSKWRWNDEDSFCPHCLQPLPIDKLETIKRESEQNFNKQKAEELKQLAELATKMQDELAEYRTLSEENDTSEKKASEELAKAKETLSVLERELKRVQDDKPRTYDAILAEKKEYTEVKQEIARLNEELDKPIGTNADDTKILSELESESQSVAQELKALTDRYATKETYDKIQNRVSEIEDERRIFQSQIDKLDEKIDLVSEFVRRTFQILSKRVNEKFSFVSWIMFQTTNDGDRKPYCECCHGGVPYSKLNDASKINAGIDIAHTISEFYDVSIPMIIDGCESVQKPLYMGGQQIRLSVGDSDTLKFDYSDGNQD